MACKRHWEAATGGAEAVEAVAVEGEAIEGEAIEGVEGEGVEGEAIKGEAIEGVEGEGVEGEGVEGVEGEGVEGEGVEGVEGEAVEEAAEVEGEAAEGEGEAAEGEGEAAEVEGEAAEVEGEAAEVEGEAAEGEAAEGEAAEVEGEAAEVEGEAAEVEGEAAEVEGEAAEVEGEGEAIEGEAEEAEGVDLDALIHAARQGATLCWDTETSGLVGHVIQIAIVAVPRATADGMLPNGHVSYCRHWALPGAVELDPRAVAVHGITRSHLNAHGCGVQSGLRAIAAVVLAGREGGAQWVAHNASFDVARLNQTATFHGAPALLERGEVFCTMLASATHCSLKTRTGRAKPPRCHELYTHLFQRPCEAQLHDALADATLLATCFLGGRRHGWW